jgi:predicted CoA-binding protein
VTTRERIDAFLSEGPWAVVGASTNRAKFGNRVLRCYVSNDKSPVFAVNPRADEIEGVPCFPDLASLPDAARAASIITSPRITEDIVQDAIDCGVKHLWMQPGAESAAAIESAEAAGLSVIAGGPCLLVELA